MAEEFMIDRSPQLDTNDVLQLLSSGSEKASPCMIIRH